MFYAPTQFPKAPLHDLYLANLDIACDMIPGLSTVTNLSRLVASLVSTTIWLGVSVVLSTYFIAKSVLNLTGLSAEKVSFGENVDRFMSLSLKIKSLWSANFFLIHVFDKSILQSTIHAIPVLGNIVAYAWANSNSYDNARDRYVNKMQGWQYQLDAGKYAHLMSYLLPSFANSVFSYDKKVHLENFRLNPLLHKKIPQEFFADEHFIEGLFQILTLYHHDKTPYIRKEEFKQIVIEIIQKAHAHEIMKDLPLPIESLLLTTDVKGTIEIINKYPIVLWMIPQGDFSNNKKNIQTVIQRYPQIISLMSDHFLKTHRSVVQQALSLNNQPIFRVSNSTAFQAFNKDSILEDDLFLRLVKVKPTFGLYVREGLKKNEMIRKLNLRRG